MPPVRRNMQVWPFDADEVDAASFKRLTQQEANQLRAAKPQLSPWWVVGMQCLAGIVVSLLAAWWVDKAAALSAGYGAIAVIIPAALFARGLMSQFSSLNAATASFGFLVWEAVKLAVSVAMLVLAPRLVANLNWLALLAGLFVTLKMYWLALLLRPRSRIVLSA